MICFVMVALAFIDGILGVFLPQIKPELGINDTQASAIFVVNLLGFAFSLQSEGTFVIKSAAVRASFSCLALFCFFVLPCSAPIPMPG